MEQIQPRKELENAKCILYASGVPIIRLPWPQNPLFYSNSRTISVNNHPKAQDSSKAIGIYLQQCTGVRGGSGFENDMWKE